MHHRRFVLAALACLALDAPSAVARSHALVLVGLPGDADQERDFRTITGQWHDWLTGPLGFDAADVRVRFGAAESGGIIHGPATREGIADEIKALREKLRAEDRLWVFFLGHADHDGERAAFHLPGPDLTERELGKLFTDLPCREQVFWMTTSASGWFLKALAAKGRIVVTATAADEEFNATEFPYALAAVSRLPTARLDTDGDGKVSVLELYRRTVVEVKARFAADNRVPTEHAQLDDNGDGRGTEEPVAPGEGDAKPTADGARAATTALPLRGKP